VVRCGVGDKVEIIGSVLMSKIGLWFRLGLKLVVVMHDEVCG